MRVFPCVFLILLIIGSFAAVSCAPGSVQSFKSPIKQPEPSRPRIGGQISGLPDGKLAMIRIRMPTGRVVKWGERLNGSWEMVVHTAGGPDYIVTAEAEGYISGPASYRIHLRGDTAYVVRNGQVTDEEAIHLDFHFVPKQSP